MRYFFEIAYDGTNYHGWQVQNNAITIQEVITEKLRVIAKDDSLNILGCGRTDTGVHAKQFFFHVDLNINLDFNDVKYRLNNMLPSDIIIKCIFNVKENAHARFDAIERTYRYYINLKKDPFSLNYSWYLNKEIDVKAMNDACVYLCEYEDFTSFSKLHTDVKTNICKLKSAFWKNQDSHLIFEITADRFLRNMVRSIVGTMIDIGIKKMAANEIHNIILSKNRSAAGASVPAKGLFLETIKYPSEIKMN
jgi:tRNA pseudouridine38-40 synthase